MEEHTALFVTGFFMGLGPCLAFCGPILFPYIAGSEKSWLGGLKDILIFSASRVVIYAILGLLASNIGYFLTELISSPKFNLIKYLGVGIFVLLLGIIMILGRTKFFFCRLLHRETIEKSTKSMILLGILIGISPCLPLLGALATIAGLAKGPLVGAFWGFSFGLGTAISPLIILALVAGGLGKLLSLKPILHQVTSRICGLFLIYFGIRLISGVLK
jgi:thiol:disulfide interchange protein DsbD